MAKTITYEEGKIPDIVRQIVGMFVADTRDDFDLQLTSVWRNLKILHPELTKKEVCANCGESMAAYWYRLNVIGASTMVKLGEAVKRRSETMPFTEANKLHVVKMNELTDAERHQTTILRFLGLLAKVKNADGKQEIGLWCLTQRGFAFLRGEPVPAKVKAFRNRIEERTGEMTTLDEIQRNAPKDAPFALLKWQARDFYSVEQQEGRML